MGNVENVELSIEEVAVHLDPDAIEDLRRRLRNTKQPPDLGFTWERGTPNHWLNELLDRWRQFDFEYLQNQLNQMVHFQIEIGDQKVHSVRVEGNGSKPMPLLLNHGWPGSFFEYQKLIPLLTNPPLHEGDVSDAFTVIIPSLPGFGFSGPPPHEGRTSRDVASIWHRVMTEGFGYERYAVHGSDLGAGVTGWLARDYPESVVGVHLATPGLGVPAVNRSASEQRFLEEVTAWTDEEGGYMHEHATKPATLAAALSDSPAGLAAWIGEKVVSWSSTNSDGSPAFDSDLFLSTLTLYWATNAVATSLLPYWASRHGGTSLPEGDPSPVPTSITIFGGERVPFPKPPRELAERFYNVEDWSEFSTGGHFPAVAEPEILATVLRKFFRQFR